MPLKFPPHIKALARADDTAGLFKIANIEQGHSLSDRADALMILLEMCRSEEAKKNCNLSL